MAAINHRRHDMAMPKNLNIKLPSFCYAIFFLVFSTPLYPQVLPDDRADLMYHSYDGGGVTVDGPAVFVRKSVEDTFSFSGSYYVDNISSASIDVVTSASKYSERREEKGLGVDYMHRDTLLRLSYVTSTESDYDAQTISFDLSQDFFGDMTTVSMGYTQGSDTVGRVDVPAFSEDIDRDQYRIGISQIITKELILSLNYEAITDLGYLNNPYRGVRLGGSSVITPNAPEVYPRTRKSHALSLAAIQHLPYNSALRFDYRSFQDTWEIRANAYELGYSKYVETKEWLLTLYYRFYNQSNASFYQDYFETEQNYMARDKELSTFTSQAIGSRLSYTFLNSPWKFIDRGTINISNEYIEFEYDDFTNIDINSSSFGKDYSFYANTLQLFVSVWY